MKITEKRQTDFLGFILNMNELAVPPNSHWFLDELLHISGYLWLEDGRLEEGRNKAVDSPLQASTDKQNGRLSHQLTQGFWVGRHEGLCVALEDEFAHLCICRNNRRGPKQVGLKHLPVPTRRPNHRYLSVKILCTVSIRTPHSTCLTKCESELEISTFLSFKLRKGI